MHTRTTFIGIISAVLIVGIGLLIRAEYNKQPRLETPIASIAPIEKPAEQSTPQSQLSQESKPAKEYKPPEVKNPGLAKLVDRRAKESERIFPDMPSRFPVVTDPIDQAALAKVLDDAHDDDTVRNEVANLLRRSNYPGLDDSLLKVLKNPEETERFRAFAAQHVGVSMTQAANEKREALLSELRKLLDDRDISVKREALLALVLAKDEVGKARAEKWLVEKSENADKMRDLTIRCIRELGLRKYILSLRGFAENTDEPVKIAAIVTLSEWKDTESLTIFKMATHSKSIRVKRAGERALKQMETP